MNEIKNNKYTCEQYRQEMTLLALKIRLNSPNLSETDKKNILINIREIEIAMYMD
ncbi:MAG: hypothetical protein KJ826_15665 [Proteobacteria bacterium]|nr:hypothetical protein [Pseudomonadota bacterium]MBU4037900.1 hypothetical protein [Pseudomonadota bacterium]